MDMLDDLGSRYRRIWGSAVRVLAAIGVAAAFVFVGWATDAVTFLMAAVMVGSIYLSIGLARELEPATLIRSVPAWAARAGLVALSVCGYAAAVGVETFWLVVLVVASSPPVLARLWPRTADVGARPRRKSSGEASPAPRPGGPQTTGGIAWQQSEHLPAEPQDLTELSDEELCLAWRRSFTQLQGSTTDAQRLVVAKVRRAYLDELERRQPEAFFTHRADRNGHTD
jgi:hypothetical protein